MGSRRLTTDQVEAFYAANPGQQIGRRGVPWLVKAGCILAGAAMVIGFVLALAH